MRAVLTGAPLYLAHFRLAEAPFSTTPDQRFLYLSERHREGFAHLLYGVAEAQHLSVEVLEQMRLLTNFETATAKLLQIILVGQPELIEHLNQTKVRQVAQRVAARYHLAPLDERDTSAYVLHRLAMAGQP